MATHILVTHNHWNDAQTYDFYTSLHEAKQGVAMFVSEELAIEDGTRECHPPLHEFLDDDQKRQITVTKNGQSLRTYRVNDNIRHCRTCHCNVRAFG